MLNPYPPAGHRASPPLSLRPMRGRNYTKLFSIAGLVLGEFYMLYAVLAPNRKGPPVPINIPVPLEALSVDTTVPLGIQILRLALYSIPFGLCGALVGLGIGLFVTGLLAKRPPPGR